MINVAEARCLDKLSRAPLLAANFIPDQAETREHHCPLSGLGHLGQASEQPALLIADAGSKIQDFGRSALPAIAECQAPKIRNSDRIAIDIRQRTQKTAISEAERIDRAVFFIEIADQQGATERTISLRCFGQPPGRCKRAAFSQTADESATGAEHADQARAKIGIVGCGAGNRISDISIAV